MIRITLWHFGDSQIFNKESKRTCKDEDENRSLKLL